MHLSSHAIIIIIAFFCVGFLLMIPFFIMNNKRKKREADYVAENSFKAVLHLYGTSPVIDGQKIKDMEYIKGKDLQYTVALTPGKHVISAKYASSEPSLGKNVNYSTPKPIESEITFEAGHEYSLAIYFYSPEQRKDYYNGDVGEDVYSQALDISSSGIGGHTAAYIICYKEK